MPQEIEDKIRMLDDFVEYFVAPIKYRHSRETYDSKYLSMGQRGTFWKLLGIVFALCLGAIVWIRFIYGSTPFYPPIYSASFEISFASIFILLNFTLFCISTTVQYLLFRVFSGKAELLTQAYLTVIGSSWTMISAVLSVFVLFLIRVESIDAWILGFLSIYLLLVMFFSFRAIHHISTIRAILAFILSIIVSVPIVIFHYILLSFLVELRPYDLSDPNLILFFLVALLIDMIVLAYMFYEQKKRQKFPAGMEEPTALKMMLRNKLVTFGSIGLIIPIAVICGQYAFKTTRPVPVMKENPSVVALSYEVVDAVFSPELNSIVMTSNNPNQLHFFNLDTGNQASMDLPLSPSIFSINQAGTHAVIGNDTKIAYLDLAAANLIGIFQTNDKLIDLALNDGKIYYSYSGASFGARSRLAVIDTRSGRKFYGERGLENAQLFAINQRLYQVGNNRPFEMRILPNAKIPQNSESFFDASLKTVWFSTDSEKFVSNTGQVFVVGTGESRTSHIGEIEGIDQITAMCHSQPTGKFLLFSLIESGLILVDDETLERKETLTLPEVEFDLWTGDYFPRFVSRYFAPTGLYVFVGNEQTKYYAIVKINVTTTHRRFAIISDDF